MTDDTTDLDQADEEILIREVSDETLEAASGRRVIDTLPYGTFWVCTKPMPCC